MFSHLLVPLDGSSLAEAALPYAFTLGKRLGAQLLLLRAQPPGPAEGGVPAKGVAAPGETLAYLEEVQRRASAQGITSRIAAVPGNAAEAILDAVATKKCDLVVMSTHGRSGITRWVLGSVADKVLHAAAVPVLLIRPKAGGGAPDHTSVLSKIIVPLDGSGLAEAALQPAEQLARSLGLSLLLVQVVDPRIFNYVGPEMSGSYQNLYTSLDRTAKDYLIALAAGPAKAGLAVETAVLNGLPGGSISDLAQNTPGSLVVMSSHGRSGLSRWALGSVAEKVARDSLAPVLILQSRVVRQRAGQGNGALAQRAPS